MRIAVATLLLLLVPIDTDAAFVPNAPVVRANSPSNTIMKGYLDDLSEELYAPNPDPDVEATTHAATDMEKKDVDRFGPGDYSKYVEFDEFDGGDGQMGVAGDGNSQLEKIGAFSGPSLVKSKTMSAKNAWGTSNGYADKLVEEGMDTQKAQRLENWQNQQLVRKKQISRIAELDSYDSPDDSGEEDWRKLAAFGVERNEEFDLDEAFGPVKSGDDAEIVELASQIGRNSIHEFKIKNEFMGFADFRAAFTADSNQNDWKVVPTEGALQSSKETEFIVRFRPNSPGISKATLVIDTEDMKKTYELIGSTA